MRAEGFNMLTQRDTDVLDALLAGANIVELDPLDTSVGYGGLPNADGIVQFDSCCMHGPKKRAGGVAAIEGVRTVTRGQGRDGANRSSPHRRKRGPDFCAGPRVQDRRRPQYGGIAQALARVEARIDPPHYLEPQKRAETGSRVMMQTSAA